MDGKIFRMLAGLLLNLSLSLSAVANVQLTKDFDQSRFLTVNDIPNNISPWIYLEQVVNNRNMGSNFQILPLDHSNLDARFDPMNRPVIKMGYLEIPVDESNSKVDNDGLSKRAKRVYFFKRGGKLYERMFIHPLMEHKYQAEIKQWGVPYKDDKGVTRYRVHYGDFAATLTASLRSWVTWNIKNPEEWAGPKTSLAVTVQTDRKNDLDKLERAYAVSLIVRGIDPKILEKLGVDFLLEPMVQNTFNIKDGKSYGNINRDYGDREMVHPNGKARYAPGFAITSAGPNGEAPLLIKMIEQSGMTAENFIYEKMMGPLARINAYLTYQLGLIGELHQQNVLFELDEKGMLTGRVLIRDLDAFKPDLRMRIIRGLSAEEFLHAKRPYKLLKMGKAANYYRVSYDEYIKSNWLENIQGALERHGQHLLKESSAGRRRNQQTPIANVMHQLSERVDKAMILDMIAALGPEAVFNSANMEALDTFNREEFKKAENLGHDETKLEQAKAEVRSPSLEAFVDQNIKKLAKILPDVNWEVRPIKISKAQARVIVENFEVGEIFMRLDQFNTPMRTMFDATVMVQSFKAQSPIKPQEGVSQSVLATEYQRLVFNYRHSSVVAVPKNGFYVLGKGIITAVDAKGQPIGHVFLEPREILEGGNEYYEGSKYPRVEPNRAMLEMLYGFIDGRISSVPDVQTLKYKFPALATESLAEAEMDSVLSKKSSGSGSTCAKIFAKEAR